MALVPDCIFCSIILGTIPADVVYRDEDVMAFNDLNPQAPTHVLLLPTIHVENAAELARVSPKIIAALFLAADEIASQGGLSGYRTLFNTGAAAGQSVFHVHLHLLGGRDMAWPPG